MQKELDIGDVVTLGYGDNWEIGIITEVWDTLGVADVEWFADGGSGQYCITHLCRIQDVVFPDKSEETCK